MKKLVLVAAFAAALCVQPAFAQSPPAADIVAAAQAAKESGQVVRTASGARLGRISRIEADGSLAVVLEDRLVVLPAATLSVDEAGRIVTSLTRSQIARLGR